MNPGWIQPSQGQVDDALEALEKEGRTCVICGFPIVRATCERCKKVHEDETDDPISEKGK